MKKYLKTFLSISLCLSFSWSFSQQNVDTAKANKEALAALNGYFTAVKEHDMSKAINYLSNTKDFIVYANGKAMNYEEFIAAIKTSFSQIKALALRYDTLYIRNINENAVWISGPLYQTVTDVNDTAFDFDVAASVILLKRDGQWKISYVTQVVQPVSN